MCQDFYTEISKSLRYFLRKVLLLKVSSFLFKTHMQLLEVLPQRTLKPAIIVAWEKNNALNLTSKAGALLNLMAFYWAGMISVVRKRVSKEIASVRAALFPHHQPGLELTGESH